MFRSLAAAPLPGLRRATTRPRAVEQAVVTAPDGVALATDVHRPVAGGRHPTVLIRTPYGRDGMTGIPMVAQARLLAARGYAVVLQDVRGRFGSGGTFVPMVHEAADGGATAHWIAAQPWSNGRVGAWGLSYLGGTAWAAAAGAPDVVTALAVGIAHSALALPDPRGLLHLDTTLRWLRSLGIMEGVEDPPWIRLKGLVDARRRDDRMVTALGGMPVAGLDAAFLGTPSAVWRSWLDSPAHDAPFWQPGDHSGFAATAPPTAHLTGWWDIFVDRQMADHAMQRAAGAAPRLLVGPWGHLDPRVQVAGLREALAHFDHHLLGVRDAPAGSRVWLSGADSWWDLPEGWPPPTTDRRWLLGGSRLVPEEDVIALTDPGPLRLRYDPADPTPTVGGRTLSFEAGRADGAALEARGDVSVLTAPPSPHPWTLAGSARLEGTVSADTGATDVWVRLSEVDAAGRSRSVCDGTARVRDAADGVAFAVDLHPVAHRFAEGGRLRIVVAGGSFPQHDRNPGDGRFDPAATGLRPTAVVVDRGARLICPVLP